jgi:hypothetical protein
MSSMHQETETHHTFSIRPWGHCGYYELGLKASLFISFLGINRLHFWEIPVSFDSFDSLFPFIVQ